MGFLSILSFAHSLIRERVHPGDIAIDATVGNGHDTLFLARLVGAAGRVYGFDIQPEALASARERLDAGSEPAANVELLLQSHADIAAVLPHDVAGNVAAVMFNLGYLPGGDHGVTTKTETTLAALNGALDMLRPGGVVTAVVYPGHEGGADEAAAVEAWAAALSQRQYQALIYRFANQRNAPPFVIAVEKRPQQTAVGSSAK